MSKQIAIIGGGPAGLMAAQQLVGQNFDVHLYDAMPSLGRKFLMAGKSGMNLTHSEEFDKFLTRYHDASPLLKDIISDFGPDQIRDWAGSLGIETFIGSSGRVFPTDFKAAPLLRAWLRDLRQKGLTTHVRHHWTGWKGNHLSFETPGGEIELTPDACIIALGSVCWPKLGSDGAWQTFFQEKHIPIRPFKPSNCGFVVNWSDHFCENFAGQPVKSVSLKVGGLERKGDFVISQYGVEGSAIYTHSRALREEIEQHGHATLEIDLAPDKTIAQLESALSKPRGSKSLSTHIKRTTKLGGVKMALLRECLNKEIFNDMPALAKAVKALPLRLENTRPIEEAISCAGGVPFDILDHHLMLKQNPGLFLAGEMLDWDAPTGGYLLTACFALGRRAGQGCAAFLKEPVLQE